MHLVAGGDVLWEWTNGDEDIGTEALKFTFGAAFDQRHNLKQSLQSADNSYLRHKSPSEEKPTALVCTKKWMRTNTRNIVS